MAAATSLIEKFLSLSEPQKRAYLEKLFSESPVLNRGLLWMTLMYDDTKPGTSVRYHAATPGLAAISSAVPTAPPSASTAVQAPVGQAPLRDAAER